MNQNPFSLYDFLGYFIPGALILAIIYISIYCNTCRVDYCKILTSVPELKLGSIVMVILLSYSLGHIFSFLSSITVEKYAEWKYGYPSYYLLKLKKKKVKRNKVNKVKYYFSCFIMGILLLPLVILDFIFGKTLNFKVFYTRPLDDFLREIAIDKIKNLPKKLNINSIEDAFEDRENVQCDFFRIIQHYTYENSKKHQSKFTNYVALYGFLRTMTLIINILFSYLLIHFIIIKKFEITMMLCSLFILCGIYIFFMAFMKFYRRYTLEGLMVLIVDEKI